MKYKTLKPIKEPKKTEDVLERRMRTLMRSKIYNPIQKVIGNGMSIGGRWDLLKAIKYGRIQYKDGKFSGRFSALISKELKALGARWDSHTGTWKLSQTSLLPDVVNAISESHTTFAKTISEIDKALSQIFPAEIAEKLNVMNVFDARLRATEIEFKRSIRDFVVAPTLSDSEREAIAKDWENNLRLEIKNFTDESVSKLRQDVQKSFYAGNRYESLYKTITTSHDVSINKAKFLARQETNLLMSKFKEVRYKSAGISKYIWTCSAGSPNHPVRPAHKALDGKIFSWDNSIEIDTNGLVKAPGGAHKPGPNKNPGEDYNCRCYAKPIIEFG